MTIILLPGLDGTGLLFAPLLAAIRDTTLLKLKETPMVLPLSYPKETLDYQALTEYVIEQLPEEDFILVGESFSGYIAYQIAKNRPKHLKSLIFVASFVSNPRPILLNLFNLLPRCVLSITPPNFIVKIFMLGFSAPKETIELFLDTLDQVPADILAFRLKEISKLKQIEKTINKSFDINICYIQATDDYLVPASNVEYLKCLFNNVNVEQVKGPHFILQTAPEECAEIICKQIF